MKSFFGGRVSYTERHFFFLLLFYSFGRSLAQKYHTTCPTSDLPSVFFRCGDNRWSNRKWEPIMQHLKSNDMQKQKKKKNSTILAFCFLFQQFWYKFFFFFSYLSRSAEAGDNITPPCCTDLSRGYVRETARKTPPPNIIERKKKKQKPITGFAAKIHPRQDVAVKRVKGRRGGSVGGRGAAGDGIILTEFPFIRTTTTRKKKYT